MEANHITTDQKKYSLDKLLNSKDFESQEKYSKLIKYLFDATIENKQIKESTIASDCFNKTSSYDPSVDSYVRVYLSKLRKKIEHFYLTEGRNESIQISIPKGQYHLEFKKIEKKQNFLSMNWKIYTFLSFLILSVGLSAYLIGLNSTRSDNNTIPQSDIIWNDIFSSKKKTLLVLGDYYFFSFPFSKDRQSYIRDVEINSESDLNKFLSDNPNIRDNIEPIYHTYLDEHIPWALSLIIPSFLSNEAEYELKLASEVQLNDLNKYNIVYIGSYKTLALLKNVIGQLNFRYYINPGANTLEFLDKSTNQVTTYEWSTDSETKARNDNAMVIKVPGPNENTLLFFLSQHDFGNLSTVKYFSNIKKIKVFEQKLEGKYFEALFDVRGIIRTDFDINLVKLNQLDSNFVIQLSNTTQ